MLINLRNALMAGKRTPTAKDYVQTGLVAMWDGIENAGWGVHDASATVWKDLINEVAFTIETGSLNFNANSIVFNADTLLSSNALLAGNYTAFEFVLSDWAEGTVYVAASTSTGNGNAYREVFKDSATGAICVCSRDQRAGGWGVEVSPSETPHTISANFSSLYNASNVFLNGTERPQVETDSSWMSRGKAYVGGIVYAGTKYPYARAHLHCIRLYSRALTASEISANYAIDKARFGLP